VLYYQDVDNLQSIDALMLSNEGELMLFQFTTAATHPVEGSSLISSVVDRFKKERIASSSLIFVVPDDSKLTTTQRIVTTGNDEYIKCPHQLRGLVETQWRLSIALGAMRSCKTELSGQQQPQQASKRRRGAGSKNK
jgi:hypothetical protein